MSKTLLTEAEIRKMMGLANLRPLGDAFVKRLDEQEMEEPEAEEAPEGEEDPEMAGPEGEEEAPPEDEPAGEDEGMEGAIEQVMSAVVDALNQLPGAPNVSMETEEGGEEMGGEPEMDMSPEAEEAEAGMEPSPEGGEDEEAEALMESLEAAGVFLDEGDYMDEDYMEEDLGMDDEEGGMDADLGDVGMELEEEELINEVTRRVGRRLAQRLGRSKRR